MKNFLETKLAKTIYFTFGIAIIVVAMGYVVKNSKLAATINSPKIYFYDTKHDFGKVPQGPQLQYNFKFTNTGTQPLKIDKVQTSCGCTGAAVDAKTEYLKGETGEISVTFNTQGRQGVQEKTITIMTNETDGVPKTLTITCDIAVEMTGPNNSGDIPPKTNTEGKIQKADDGTAPK